MATRQVYFHHWKNTSMCMIFWGLENIIFIFERQDITSKFSSCANFVSSLWKEKFLIVSRYVKIGEKYQCNSVHKQALSKRNINLIFQIGWMHLSNYLSDCSTVPLCFLAAHALLWFHKKNIKYSVCLWDVSFWCVCHSSWELPLISCTVLSDLNLLPSNPGMTCILLAL